MSTNSSTPKISVKQSGSQGPRGFQGWTPVIVQVPDGNRLVNFLQSYIGGTGPLPVALTNLVGKYQKADGTWTADIAQAFDINSGSAANAALATTRSNSAQAFASTAGTMAANAAGSASTASTKADEAFTSAANAATANTNAQTAKTAAETAATTATTKAAEAVASATNAAASAATSSAVALGVSTGRNSISPSILLDFANTQQLDSRLVFTRASTATYFDRTGILRTAPANVPCFNFNPETLESDGLQIFESSTNVSWGISANSNLILTPNSAIAPDGTNTAFKAENTPLFNSVINLSSSTTATNGFWTRSIFVKSNNSTYSSIFFEGIGDTTGSGGAIEFNINTKNFNGGVGLVIDKGYQICQNGWIRVWITCEKTSSNTVFLGNIYVGGYGNSQFQHSLFVWGAQNENKRYPTPYIYTTNAAVTRQADVCQFSSALFNLVDQKKGTWLAVIKKPMIYNYARIIGTNASANYLELGGTNDAGVWDGTGGSLRSQSGISQTNILKVAMSWTTGLTKRVCVDNSAVLSATSNPFLPSLITLGSGGGSPLNSCIKKIAYYPVQLSDTELRELTSVKLAGEATNQLPSVGDLGGTAFMQIRSLLGMRARSEVNYHGTGTQVSYTIRRPYAFTLGVVNSNGSTTTTLPTANADGTYTADMNYTLLHNAPVGTALTLEIIPVLF